MSLRKETVDAMGGLALSTLSVNDLSLEVIEGPHRGTVLHLDREFVRIGRAEWCDLVLSEDTWISHIHCDCHLSEDGLRVRDLSSRNGIKIEGVPVFDARLELGARLRVGQSVLRLKSHQKKTELQLHFCDEVGGLVGRSEAMRSLFSLLPRLAQRQVTTLLTGETGTGKTSIAQALHRHRDPESPFVVVNCGALPSTLIEAALFGHEKGAFTGADKRHKGYFEQANGGTLFLDEIGELPLELQPKLLDVIERRVVRRIGSDREHAVSFHLITATHRQLERECQSGGFRQDLFFRISVMKLHVPALRERLEDLPLLVEAFLKEMGEGRPLFITEQAVAMLESHPWPGNIRQLRNVLERTAALMTADTIDTSELRMPESGVPLPQPAPSIAPVSVPLPETPESRAPLLEETLPVFPLSAHEPSLSLKDILAETERALLHQALEETDHTPKAAAKLLNISESWLYNRIKRYGLSNKD